MIDNQYLFDTVVNHLRTQKVQAVKDGECMYRGEDGTSCAVGCLIKDEFYDPVFEGEDVSGVRECLEDSFGESLSERNLLILNRLQGLHDYNEQGFDTRTFEEDAKEIASTFKLVYTAPKLKEGE